MQLLRTLATPTHASPACFWFREFRWRIPTGLVSVEFKNGKIFRLFFSFFFLPPIAECYEGFGESYQGEQSRTRSNLPCAPWSDHNNRSAERVRKLFRNFVIDVQKQNFREAY